MNAALVPALEAAVPLHMLDVGAWTPEQRIAYCYEHAQDIASRSDVLMFGGKKGEAAQLFNVLARALACLAFQPGGVRLALRRPAPRARPGASGAPSPAGHVGDNGARLPTR